MLRRGCLDRPVERGAEVVDVALGDAAPLEVLSAPQVRTGRFGQRDVVVGVATSHRDRVATRVEALPRVLADGLEQAVAHPAVCVVDDDEGLVHQLTQHVDHVRRVEIVVGQDRLRRREVTATGEHRQPLQRMTLGRGEQVIGPVDRAPQRLVALRSRATAVGEELEPLIEPGDEILR